MSSEAFATFNTPNVVHFGFVLLVAAILSAPWQALWLVGVLLGLCGLGGATYAVIVLRRVRRQSDYRPVLEDWLFHTVLPLVSYTVLVIAGICSQASQHRHCSSSPQQRYCCCSSASIMPGITWPLLPSTSPGGRTRVRKSRERLFICCASSSCEPRKQKNYKTHCCRLSRHCEDRAPLSPCRCRSLVNHIRSVPTQLRFCSW